MLPRDIDGSFELMYHSCAGYLVFCPKFLISIKIYTILLPSSKRKYKSTILHKSFTIALESWKCKLLEVLSENISVLFVGEERCYSFWRDAYKCVRSCEN